MPLSQLVLDRKGAGETVVLIHGIGHRRQAWYPIFDRLSERYDVIAVDLAGFGDSPPYAPGIPYDMENACRDLTANFAEWGIERPHVVGNSLGGAIALELASRGLVSSVTALSPAGFFRRFDFLRALAILGFLRLTSQAPDAVLRAVARSSWGRRLIGFTLFAHPERHDFDAVYGDAQALKHCRAFAGVARAGARYEFDRTVEVPTTIAWGTADRILPYVQSGIAASRLPGAVHVPLVGAGHVPMVDAPDRIIELIDQTVARAQEGELTTSA
ncbi:alpha/beta hydrolase [Nocardioides seonyuensis]|uniref:Alpha/beta hydrolase n=1 Tax=Nocardioides seonyuensis TaxID=2518371 RepID=A0A4P7ICI5_9ACTN|nr:alpha/beta hydrolase [Nocardioides seonyuensis]QBX54814.1 alpha/beta hydrolase [Nocardioides seonyuensis]